MNVVYLDCFSGCAGDMCLGALVDAGCDPERLRTAIAGLGLGREFDLRFERVTRGALAATHAIVDVHPPKPSLVRTKPEHPHRRLKDVLALIRAAGLAPRAAARAEAIFAVLAAAEAKVHGTTPDDVHFHEVGAVDAIVDICGTAAALEILGIDEVYSSEATVGRGTIRAAHGELPAPGPAVLAILQGRPIRTRDVGHELTTPTGAAILAALAGDRFGPIPPMRLRATGIGAGTADFPSHPNVLRALVGELALGPGAAPAAADTGKGAPERCVVLEANLDDLTPQLVSNAVDALLEAGALDAFTIPCFMKKGRPGHLLTALAREEDVARLEAVFFRETTTFGVRRRLAERTVLAREVTKVTTPYGDVEVKLGRRNGAVTIATPEYESARRVAESSRQPLRTVLEAARAAAQALVK